MVDQEQVEILKQGAEKWNKWREDYPDTEIDLSGANLEDTDVSEAWRGEGVKYARGA